MQIRLLLDIDDGAPLPERRHQVLRRVQRVIEHPAQDFSSRFKSLTLLVTETAKSGHIDHHGRIALNVTDSDNDWSNALAAADLERVAKIKETTAELNRVEVSLMCICV